MMNNINYTLIRADRKSIAIKISDSGEVIVRAPRRATKADIDKVVEDHRKWIERHVEAARLCTLREKPVSAEEETALKRAAADILPKITHYYSELTGLRCAAVKIGSAKKRFGSCSSQGNISYSYLLMLYPIEAIEYVVLHEICHLRFMNHSGDFYALVERYMPDWRERRKLLRRDNRKSAAKALEELKY